MQTMRSRIERNLDAGIGRGCRKAALTMALAGAVVASEGITKVAGAEEKPSQTANAPAVSVPSVDVGAGVNLKTEDTRFRAVLGLRTRISDGLLLNNSFGIHSKMDGTVHSEELNADLRIGIIGPLSMNAFAGNSAHLNIKQYAAGGNLGLKLPIGAVLAGAKYLRDTKAVLPFAGVNIDIVPEHLSVLALGGHTTNTGLTIARLGVTVTPVRGLPSIVLDSFDSVKSGKLVFSDLVAGLRYEF